MNREEALTRLRLRSHQAFCEYVENGNQENEEAALDVLAYDMAIAALREKAERERGWGCAYCVIGRRSPDAEYCSNCGRKLTPRIPELANESEEVNPDSHQYVDNDSTNRRKSVKQKCRNLHSETAETCTVTQEQPKLDARFGRIRRVAE